MEADRTQPGSGYGGRQREAVLAIELALVIVLIWSPSYWWPRNASLLRESVLLGTLALAGASALLATGRSLGWVRTVWSVVPLICVLWAAGEGSRLAARHYGAGAGSQWLLAGTVALAAYVLLLAAAMRALAGSSAIAWSLGLLDIAVVAVAAGAPWLELLVFPRLESAGGNALLPQLLAPVLAGLVVVVTVFALQAAPVRSSWSYVFFSAVLAGFGGDLLAVRHLLAHGSSAAALGGWEGRALLILVAGACVGGAVQARERRLLRLAVARLVAVIVAYAAALAYAASAFERGKQLAGFTVAITTSVLLVLRLLMQAFERHRHSEQLEQALREQEQLAVMDSLTGLYNRRFLDAELRLELDRGARSQEPVGILLCDLDHFKQINDNYGHLVGDSVLREVARRLLGAIRNGDLVARYGGEEFVMLLPGGNKELLAEIGERCRRAFDEAPFYLPGGSRERVTVSIGGACWPEDASDPRALFQAADSALYRAKAEGRNRIWIYVNEPGVGSGELAGEMPEVVMGPALQTAALREHGNGERMGRWAGLVARALGLDEQAQRRCELAARYHDVGKTVLPESILLKRGPLSGVEWELVHEHPERGAVLVELAPELASVGTIIREHHERFDGRGYPHGKSRDEISTEARIVACCDAWSAMRRDRPYAPAKTASEARAELLAGRGTQFDPSVVMAFLMFDEADFDGAVSVS